MNTKSPLVGREVLEKELISNLKQLKYLTGRSLGRLCCIFNIDVPIDNIPEKKLKKHNRVLVDKIMEYSE